MIGVMKFKYIINKNYFNISDRLLIRKFARSLQVEETLRWNFTVTNIIKIPFNLSQSKDDVGVVWNWNEKSRFDV